MNYNISEVTKWMVQEGYFIVHKGNYVVSMKFNEAVRGEKVGVTKKAGKLLVMEPGKPAPGLSPDEWKDVYMKFIVNAAVPKYAAGSGGTMYEVNKFSIDACRVFQKMIETEGIELGKLTAVARMYYANRRKALLTISNYITQGAWRTDYAQAGNIADEDKGGTAYEMG